LIRLRRLEKADIPVVVALGEQVDMGGIDEFSDVMVAVDDADELVGFLRICIVDDVAYVNPVVVAQEHRGEGIGRLLMREASGRFPGLQLVARGDLARGFYATVGFWEVSWEDIADDIVDQCRYCPNLEECDPMPMRYLSEE